MPTNETPLHRPHRLALSREETESLQYGDLPGRLGAFADDEERRAAWFHHRDRLLRHCRHGQRPAAWWDFESPVPRPRDRDYAPATLFVGRLIDCDRARRAAGPMAGGFRTGADARLCVLHRLCQAERRGCDLAQGRARQEGALPMERNSESVGPEMVRRVSAPTSDGARARGCSRAADAGSLTDAARTQRAETQRAWSATYRGQSAVTDCVERSADACVARRLTSVAAGGALGVPRGLCERDRELARARRWRVASYDRTGAEAVLRPARPRPQHAARQQVGAVRSGFDTSRKSHLLPMARDVAL
jgi:hypothetical protein